MKTRRFINQPPRGNRANPYARARIKAGFTQKEVSRKLQIDTKVISNIENDHYNPTPDIVVAMEKLYGDNSLSKKICYGVCAIGRARLLPFDLNLKVVIPIMMRRFDEIQGILNQLSFMLEEKENSLDFDRDEWKLLIDYADRIQKFGRDVEILEASVDRMIEQAEKKTAFAAKR